MIRRFLRKLFRLKPKYNGTAVAFYKKNDKGEWEKISDINPIIFNDNDKNYQIIE